MTTKKSKITKSPERPRGSYLPESKRRRGFSVRMSEEQRDAMRAAAGPWAMSSWLRAAWQRAAAASKPIDQDDLRPGDWRMRVNVSLSDDERAAYEAAADKAGVPLSAWLRAVGMAAAREGFQP